MDIEMMAIGIIFLVAATAFNYLGYAKSILLLQLFAFLMSAIGGIWLWDQAPDLWFLPMLFIIANLLLFVFPLMKGVG